MVLVTVFSPYGAHTHASTAGVSRALFFRTCEKVSSQNRPPPKTSSELCSLQSTVEKKTKDQSINYISCEVQNATAVLCAHERSGPPAPLRSAGRSWFRSTATRRL